MKMRERQVRWAERGAMSFTSIIIMFVVIVATGAVLYWFLNTAKEATTAVSDRNQKVIESKKALVIEQTERLKNLREAQEAP